MNSVFCGHLQQGRQVLRCRLSGMDEVAAAGLQGEAAVHPGESGDDLADRRDRRGGPGTSPGDRHAHDGGDDPGGESVAAQGGDRAEADRQGDGDVHAGAAGFQAPPGTIEKDPARIEQHRQRHQQADPGKEAALGHRNPEMVEVVSGLEDGDRVISHPSDRISVGVLVNERGDN